MLVLAVVVVAAGCTSQPGQQSNVSDTGGSAGNNTIFFTDSGFEPETLTVEKGETVTWIDRSRNTMWVASDVHPSHRQYSGTSLQQHCSNGGDAFDQCGTGERYRFTFDKTGEWSYHNHQPFVQGGKIIVE